MAEDGEAAIGRAVRAQLRQRVEAPVAALVAFTEMLLEDLPGHGAADLAEDVEKMRAAGLRLAELVAGTGGDAARAGRDRAADQRRLRHDLRTPLNAIIGYAELVAEDAEARGLAQVVADLERIRAAARELVAAIDGFVAPAGADRDRGSPEAMVAATLFDEVAVPARTPPGAGGGRHAAILVVDDNETNREVIARRLARDGHRVTLAAGGREALARLDAESFDLILLDLLMPDLNGYEVLQQVQRSPRWREIPVIMVSAINEMVSTIRCIEAGAADYLQKPVDPVLLRARIGALLERQWLREREQMLVRREIETAVAIQRSLLPPEPADDTPVCGINRAFRYVSGDFFDYFVRPDGLVPFALGDVSGKGFDAAILMAKIAGLFRYLAKTVTDPGVLLTVLNTELVETATHGRFVTAVVGFYDGARRQVRFGNAGHVPPVLLTPGEAVVRFEAADPPLGVLPDLSYETVCASLAPAARFVVVTDGVIECRCPNGPELGLEGLTALLADTVGLSAKASITRLLAGLDAAPWHARDDLTVVILAPPAL